MKILAVYRHYWPDTTPYAWLLREILEHLAREGHEVSVFTSQPSYNDLRHARQPTRENLGGVSVQRISLFTEKKNWPLMRALNFAIFLIRSVCHAVWKRDYDLVLANGHPPIFMGMTLRVIRWLTGTPFVLHMQDVHPESAMYAGKLKDGWIAKRLQQQDTRNCQAARCVVTLSEDMRQSLLRRDGAKARDMDIRVVSNFPLVECGEVDDSQLPQLFRNDGPAGPEDRPFRILFAGNMGHYQRLERVIEAAKLFEGQTRIQFIFMGAGAVREKLRQQAGDMVGRTVFFEPYLPVDLAFACMQRSDLGLISLSEDVYRVAYPTKTMTYLAAGLPVLAVVERKSQVADDVLRHQFGYVPADATPSAIANAIRCAIAERSQWDSRAREKLVERAEQKYGRESAMRAWTHLMQELQKEIDDPVAPTVVTAKNMAA